MMKKDQLDALAVLISALRPDWDVRGILTALRDCHDRDTPAVCHAAIHAATEPRNRTPAVIPLAGTHWQTAGSDRTPTPPRLCRECRYPHDPARPDEHPEPLGETWTRQAAAEARTALQRAKETSA